MNMPIIHTRARPVSIAGPHVDAQPGLKLLSPSATGAPPPAPATATPMRASDLAGKLNSALSGVAEAKLENQEDLTEREVRVINKALATAHGDVTDAAIKIEKNLLRAKSVGVDATRKAFWTKVLGVAVAALALSVVISLTVASGGAPLAAAVAVAGVIFAVSVADACCAHMNRRNAKALEDGGTPPYRLHMGDSSIGNLIYMACSGHMKHGAAKNVARCIDNGLRLGMMLAGALCTGGASIAVNSFEQIAPMVAGGVNVLTMLVNLKSTWGSQATYAKHVKDIQAGYETLRIQANKLPLHEREVLLKQINDSERDALPEIDAMRGAVPRRGHALIHSTLGLSMVVTGLVAALMPGSTLASIRLPSGPQAFVAPTTGGLGGIGTTKVRPEKKSVPQASVTAKAPVRQDGSRNIEAVRFNLQLISNQGRGNELGYKKMMDAARDIITELDGGVIPDNDYLHDVLRKAINQLKVPEAEANRLKATIPADKLGKPGAQQLDVPDVAAGAVSPISQRETQINDLAESFEFDLELDIAKSAHGALSNELLTRAGDMLKKSNEDASPADKRDLLVDVLAKLRTDKKIGVAQATFIINGLSYEDLQAIESRMPPSEISLIAQLRVRFEDARAGNLNGLGAGG